MLIVVTFFIFGLIIGSFLNVVILRLEKEETLGGRSHCPHCEKTIAWYDNIPVFSFLLLHGRCRHCSARISWQYPLVELGTALLFAVFGSLLYHTGSQAEFVRIGWYLFLVALFIVIAVYDGRNMEIPLILLLAGVGGTVLYAGIGTWFSGESFLSPFALWREMLWGGAIGAAFFYVLVYFSKETWMGMGDVWIAGIAGAVVGLPSLLFLFTLSFFIGALVGGGMLLFGKKGMQSQIPFAPFLTAGTLITMVLDSIQPFWYTLLLFPYV